MKQINHDPSLPLQQKRRALCIVPKASILPNRPHLGTTDISVFSGICFSAYFTILFILTPIYIVGVRYIVFQIVP